MPIQDLLNPNNYVTKPEYRERLNVCNDCPLRLQDSGGNRLHKFSTCPECGCIISLKTKLKTENCPVGYW